MFESGITYVDLTYREASLSDNYSFSNLTQFVLDAKIQLEDLIKNRGLKVRNLCKRLTLTNTVKSDEDLIERQRIVVIASAATATATIAIQGTNDDSGETWTTITPDSALSFTTAATISTLIHDTYKFYKLTSTGTITYTAYLVETSFELSHLYLSLMLAYKSLKALEGDVWEGKSKEYEMKFDDTFANANYSYDSDESGDVSETEMEVHQVTWRR